MSVEINKALVLRFCELINARQLDRLFELVAEDASWTTPYRSDRFPFGGSRDKTASRQMIGGFLAGFSDLEFTVDAVTAEGDRVAIEAHSAGKGPGAASYANVYSMHFLVRDGKIRSIREFLDPFEVQVYVEQLPQPLSSDR